MHWLDRLARRRLRHLPPRERVFRDGWGDQDLIDAYLGRVRTLPPPGDPPITTGPTRRKNGMVTQDLTFESPAEDLPDPVRSARARLITSEDEPQRVAILMSQWNDHDVRARYKLASMLLEKGIASIIPVNPYYEDRAPIPDDPQPIATVADFGMMGRAAVLEGRVLAAHLAGAGYEVGISGYSMGGNLAAFVATGLSFPVAAAPLAASHSPAPVFLDGIMRNGIAWDALGGENEKNERRLRTYLGSATIVDHIPPPYLRAAVLLGGTVDGFVPTSAVQVIHRHWPGSEMDWVNAGHGLLLWRRKDRLVDAIERSFDRLAQLGSGSIDAGDRRVDG
jgi:hypothetical protein